MKEGSTSEENSDAVWGLLGHARRFPSDPGFSKRVAQAAAQERAGVWALVRFAPASWKAAAAAVLLFASIVAGVSVFSTGGVAVVSTEGQGNPGSVAESGDFLESLGASDPIGDAFAVDGMDQLLAVDDPDALDDEDLLLLLLPDPELL